MTRNISAAIAVSIVFSVMIACMADPPPVEQTASGAEGPIEIPELERLDDFAEWVTSLDFSQDGSILAVGTYNKIQFCTVNTRKIASVLQLQHGFVESIDFCPDRTRLVAGGYQAVDLVDFGAKKKLWTNDRHGGQVTEVAVAPDGTLIASCSDDGSLQVCRTDDGSTVWFTSGDDDVPLQSVAWSADGSQLAVATGDPDRPISRGLLRIHNTVSGECQVTLAAHEKAALGVILANSGRIVVSCGADEAIVTRDAKSHQVLVTFTEHARPVNAIQAVPNSNWIVSGSGGAARGHNEVMLWELSTGNVRAKFEPHAARVSCLAVSPDGKLLVTGSFDQSIAFWDISRVTEFPPKGDVK